MSRIDVLLDNYSRHVSQPLRDGLPLSQRVWFAVYPPEEERRLMGRMDEFEITTTRSGLAWRRLDLSNTFSDWLDTFDDDERVTCLSNPEILESYADQGFRVFVRDLIQSMVENPGIENPSRTVFAVTGLMELYDFVHVSAIIDNLDATLPGILLVFFPGSRLGNTYSFLNARAGWDYLAIPILAES